MPEFSPTNAESDKLANLATLPRMAVAQVMDVLSHENDARLKAMGICSGRTVQVVQSGDPLIVRVLGTRVGLSARLASQVMVEPTSGQIESQTSQPSAA